jgi:hypothetical protein
MSIFTWVFLSVTLIIGTYDAENIELGKDYKALHFMWNKWWFICTFYTQTQLILHCNSTIQFNNLRSIYFLKNIPLDTSSLL